MDNAEYLLLKCIIARAKDTTNFATSLTRGYADDLTEKVLCLTKDIELNRLI